MARSASPAIVEPLDADLIERLENHTFDTVKNLQWRNTVLDFGSLSRLHESLRQIATRGATATRADVGRPGGARSRVGRPKRSRRVPTAPSAVERLWEVCQVPDYRKISSQNHAELVATLYGFLMSDAGRIPEDWFTKQVDMATARTVTSTHSPIVSRIFAPGLLLQIAPTGLLIMPIGRGAHGRSRTAYLMRCTSSWRSVLSI